jgi:Uma2 family endonuclease
MALKNRTSRNQAMAQVMIEPIPRVADLLAQLGDIPPSRILMRPAPGTATEQDVIALLNRHDRHNRLCELVDGVLVEKTMGYEESALAALLVIYLGNLLQQHDLGIVAGADGPLRLLPGLVRLPDVSFVSWNHLPSRHYPKAPIPDLVPDLAVEVLSEGNTSKEMEPVFRTSRVEYLRITVGLRDHVS